MLCKLRPWQYCSMAGGGRLSDQWDGKFRQGELAERNFAPWCQEGVYRYSVSRLTRQLMTRASGPGLGSALEEGAGMDRLLVGKEVAVELGRPPQGVQIQSSRGRLVAMGVYLVSSAGRRPVPPRLFPSTGWGYGGALCPLDRGVGRSLDGAVGLPDKVRG